MMGTHTGSKFQILIIRIFDPQKIEKSLPPKAFFCLLLGKIHLYGVKDYYKRLGTHLYQVQKNIFLTPPLGGKEKFFSTFFWKNMFQSKNPT